MGLVEIVMGVISFYAPQMNQKLDALRYPKNSGYPNDKDSTERDEWQP